MLSQWSRHLDIAGFSTRLLVPSIMLGTLAASIATDTISFEMDGKDACKTPNTTADVMLFAMEIRNSCGTSIPDVYRPRTVTVTALVGLASFFMVVANLGATHLAGFCLNVAACLLLMIEVGVFSQVRTDFNTNYATPESGRFNQRLSWGPALTFHIVSATALIFSCVAHFAAYNSRRKGKRPRLVYYCFPQIVAMLACCGGVRAAQAWHTGSAGQYVAWHYFDISVDQFLPDAHVCSSIYGLNIAMTAGYGVSAVFAFVVFVQRALLGRERRLNPLIICSTLCCIVALGLGVAHGFRACDGWLMIHFGPSVYLLAVACFAGVAETCFTVYRNRHLYADETPLLN